MTVFFRRIRKEIEALRAEVQELRDKLAEREQELEPCIGFVFEQPDEYELGCGGTSFERASRHHP